MGGIDMRTGAYNPLCVELSAYCKHWLIPFSARSGLLQSLESLATWLVLR